MAKAEAPRIIQPERTLPCLPPPERVPLCLRPPIPLLRLLQIPPLLHPAIRPQLTCQQPLLDREQLTYKKIAALHGGRRFYLLQILCERCFELFL